MPTPVKPGSPYRFRVSNDRGDEAERVVHVPPGVNPRRYSFVAIACARRVLPIEEPFRVDAITPEPQSAAECGRHGPGEGRAG